MNSLFINASDTVVNKIWWQKHCHQKNFSIILLSFFKRSESFGIHDHILFSWILFTLNKLRPDPKTFSTSVNCRANFKSIILVKKYSIENVTLSSSVFSNNCYNTYMFLLVDLFTKPLYCLRIYRKLYKINGAYYF